MRQQRFVVVGDRAETTSFWGLAQVAKGFHEPRYRALIDILVAERKRLGWSQQALAEKVGLPQQIVSRYETGDRRLDIIEFVDISAALGLSASRLIDNDK